MAAADETTPLLASASESAWAPRDVAAKRAVAIPLSEAEYILSVFRPGRDAQGADASEVRTTRWDRCTHAQVPDDADFFRCVELARAAISNGLHPRMISAGTSGSYFVRIAEGGQQRIFGVFKPMDEEPYGNLNPKRMFLRKYLWWAMGRPWYVRVYEHD